MERSTTKGRIAWQTVPLPRQPGEGRMQREAAGEGGRKWKRRRRTERGEACIRSLMEKGFFKFKERGVESGDEKCKVNRERERETGG